MARFYQSENSSVPTVQASGCMIAHPGISQSSSAEPDIAAPRLARPDIAHPGTARREPRPQQLYPAKSTQLQELSKSCGRCGFDLLVASKPRGTREEFLDLLGIRYYRCHKCEARYARVGSRNINRQPRKERTHVWALLAISVGLLSCTALALYIQKLAHRWPF